MAMETEQHPLFQGNLGKSSEGNLTSQPSGDSIRVPNLIPKP